MLELLLTALVGASPILEIRGAIPLGHFLWDLPIWQAAIAGIIGNIIAVAILLWALPKIVLFVDKRIPFIHAILKWIFEKTHAKHSNKMVILGEIFLILFVAIPLPGSGAWTGALLAYLFDVKYRTALTMITIGIFLAAGIISAICFGGEELMEKFFLHVPK